jgi:hypothetical protein
MQLLAAIRAAVNYLRRKLAEKKSPLSAGPPRLRCPIDRRTRAKAPIGHIDGRSEDRGGAKERKDARLRKKLKWDDEALICPIERHSW